MLNAQTIAFKIHAIIDCKSYSISKTCSVSHAMTACVWNLNGGKDTFVGPLVYNTAASIMAMLQAPSHFVS